MDPIHPPKFRPVLHRLPFHKVGDQADRTIRRLAVLEPLAHRTDGAAGKCVEIEDIMRDGRHITVEIKIVITRDHRKIIGNGFSALPEMRHDGYHRVSVRDEIGGGRFGTLQTGIEKVTEMCLASVVAENLAARSVSSLMNGVEKTFFGGEIATIGIFGHDERKAAMPLTKKNPDGMTTDRLVIAIDGWQAQGRIARSHDITGHAMPEQPTLQQSL